MTPEQRELERRRRVDVAAKVIFLAVLTSTMITGAAFMFVAWPSNMAIAGVTVIGFLWFFETIMDWVDGEP